MQTLNKNCRKLIHLNLQQCKNVRAPCLQQVFRHNALRTLNLAFIDNVSDDAFSLLPLSGGDCIHPSLRALNLCRSKITDFGIFKIIVLQDLEEIHLPWCTGITDAGIVALVGNCRKLKIIDLKSCPITDVALQAIGQRCSNLLDLDLSWCFGVTDSGLLELLPTNGSQSTLTSLSLIWCSQIDDESVAILSRITSLKNIQLKGSAVTQEGVNAMLQSGIAVEL